MLRPQQDDLDVAVIQARAGGRLVRPPVSGGQVRGDGVGQAEELDCLVDDVASEVKEQAAARTGSAPPVVHDGMG